ncbi:Serine/threonine-protein kinase MST20 [Purpureocillium lavendulum]|uniref:Serine/threonine-protein kinase MST20 n=1 Tax=Purpureocillium lavendulum TaxID=1247861 RepID=A0AB34FFY7_9HYPO|nr:Serine/threonine-protein kinase MST20 [Purpureocillium lavendulum]
MLPKCDARTMATPWPEDQTWPTDYREHAAKLSTYLQKAMSSIESTTGPPIEPQKAKHAFFGALTLIIKVQGLPNLTHIHEANTIKAISDIRDELQNANKISQQTITTIQDNANVALATGATAKEAVEIGKATYKMNDDKAPRKCADCRGEHEAWSGQCPKRKEEMAKVKAAYKARPKYHPETPLPLMSVVDGNQTRTREPVRPGRPGLEPRQSQGARPGRSRSPTKKIQKRQVPTSSQPYDKNADISIHVASDSTDAENARPKRAVTRTRRALESLDVNMHWTQDSPQMDIDDQE